MKKIVIMVKNPEFLEGQNQTFYKNNKDDISFVLTIDKDELDEGGSVYIDGNLVDKNNYVLDSNVKGVTLTLKKEYLDTLDKGNHEIKVKALYGEVLSAFKVEKNILNPETGNKITIMFILMFICIESIIIYKRKMKKLA